MSLKTKIFKILPVWLVSLIAISALFPAVFLLASTDSQNSKTDVKPPKNYQPLVLGEATSIRGEALIENQSQNIKKIAEPDLSGISSKNFLVFDLESGQNLIEKNSAAKLSIASLTKLLTAFVAYQNMDLNQTLTVNSRDALNIKPNLGLIPGDKIKALDLLNAMLIGSCNDAALSLANYVSGITGQSFVKMMNLQAQTLGMDSSSFSNPMGFDSKLNYSTAQDLKKLITAAEALAALKTLGRRSAYEFTGSLGRGYFTVASNKLIKNHPDLQAIKTGFTEGSGGAMATKVTIGGKQIVILVLASRDREGDTLKLKDEIVASFNFH